MKFLTLLTLLAAFASLPLLAAAKETDKGHLELTSPAWIGATQLKPGDYQVDWNGNGPTVQVRFLKHHDLFAQAPARIVELKKPARSDALVFKPIKNGEAQAIDEIDFQNHSQALKMEPGANGTHTGVARR
jgi:hypothetical protein